MSRNSSRTIISSKPNRTPNARKYTSAPHPFILEPFTNSRKSCQEGEDFSFGLTLIGRATDYLPYFIYAFEELGRIGIGKGRGKYELREVTEEGGAGYSIPKKRVIYSGDTKRLTQTNPPIQWSEIIANSPKPPHTVSISFITPTRIKYRPFRTVLGTVFVVALDALSE